MSTNNFKVVYVSNVLDMYDFGTRDALRSAAIKTLADKGINATNYSIDIDTTNTKRISNPELEFENKEDAVGFRSFLIGGWADPAFDRSVTEFTINASKTAKTKMFYGGSAYVKVKNSKGNEYYRVATEDCNHSNIGEAQSYLRTKIKTLGVTLETSIHYSIDSAGVYSIGNHTYSGTASAKVQNFKTGDIRTVTASTSGNNHDRGQAKTDLTLKIQDQLNHQDGNNEQLITPITYHIQ
ncbi:hypothetical protein A9P82_13635 [Arachidicoccus ginsenosidimutans]|uniref:hypothetical protein n=1 Tax=Arachidicoccus sp. BS20 TaxID=1850526 RepID=UPI0007F099AD|nr:hypothetical protein [Arachidicoccus sp. BS20]ANI90240.1 hypothetical protein A9P82_13635 [Arachidicoccus sp. BS20]